MAAHDVREAAVMRTPRERCLALIEVRRILAELWAEAQVEHERQLFERALVEVGTALRDLCKAHGLPFNG